MEARTKENMKKGFWENLFSFLEKKSERKEERKKREQKRAEENLKKAQEVQQQEEIQRQKEQRRLNYENELKEQAIEELLENRRNRRRFWFFRFPVAVILILVAAYFSASVFLPNETQRLKNKAGTLLVMTGDILKPMIVSGLKKGLIFLNAEPEKEVVYKNVYKDRVVYRDKPETLYRVGEVKTLKRQFTADEIKQTKGLIVIVNSYSAGNLIIEGKENALSLKLEGERLFFNLGAQKLSIPKPETKVWFRLNKKT